MSMQFNIYLLLVILLQLSFVCKVRSTSTDEHKRSLPAYFERYAVDPSYLLTNRPYYDDSFDGNTLFFKKRQIKKKWAQLFERSHSPYTIAFPALIRTRRANNKQ